MMRDADHVIVGAGIAGLWLARALLETGRRVTVVEIGPRAPEHAPPARPALRFPERDNLGAVRARNQTVTGNSSFWGGAMIRNEPGSLVRMFDLDSGSNALDEFDRSYQAVERRLRAAAGARTEIGSPASAARLSDVNVLPGRHRNIARAALGSCLASPRFRLVSDADVTSVELGAGDRLAAMHARTSDGTMLALRADHFVLAAGVIDSNVFALTRLKERLHQDRDAIGTGLHDHWSVPIARLRWRRGAGLEWLYPPTFRNGLIRGRRVELEVTQPWGVHSGFLHLQADYDRVEPYATIKKWMNARQEGLDWSHQARYLPPLVLHAADMARIGVDRVVRRRLFVPTGMELTITLDFESSSSPQNRITIEDGQPNLYWDVREQDLAVFTALLARGAELVKTWARESGVGIELLVTDDASDEARAYFMSHALDAYHLGGGLAVSRDGRNGPLAGSLRFHKIPNLAVLGTAAFARPGIANPVETLLAMCHNYARAFA